MGMDELRVDNGDIALRVAVTGEGPTVLCVPGWPELGSSWRHQVAHLAARGHTVATLDVRGYGGSSAPPEGPLRSTAWLKLRTRSE